jgi:TPR repeat protein
MTSWAGSIENVKLQQLARRCLCDDPRNRPSMDCALTVLECGDEGVARIVKQARSFRDGTGGVAKNATKAMELYRRAAAAGSADATTYLGYCSDTGTGVANDSAKAVRLYRDAADDSNADAICSLNECDRTGRSVAKDPAQAVELYWRAADAGSVVAICGLGNCHRTGTGVANDTA